MNGRQLAAPEGVLEAIPELEFDQMANLAAEAGHDLWTHPAGADAEPISELKFVQVLAWDICAAEKENTSERGWVWFGRRQGAVRVVDRESSSNTQRNWSFFMK